MTITELCALVSRYPNALLRAGGTDIGLRVTKRLRELDTVIYLGSVPDLGTIDAGTDRIEIGATVTLTDAMKAICGQYPELEELFIRFASPPIRNAGTLGGNVANGSPIGDSMPALIALGASVVLRRGDATRELRLDRFYIDYQRNDLRPTEFLQSIRVPGAVASKLQDLQTNRSGYVCRLRRTQSATRRRHRHRYQGGLRRHGGHTQACPRL